MKVSKHKKIIYYCSALFFSSLVITLFITISCKAAVPSALKKENDAYAHKLFDQVKTDRAKDIFTQSEAHLSVPEIQKKVQQSNLLKHKNIQQEAFNKEREYRQTHYVFYTAVPPQFHILQDITMASFLRLLQDLTKALYKRVIQPLPELKDFYFLRYTFKDPRYDKYENVTQFMKEQIETNGLVDDNNPEIKPILVSTNIAYFGNEGLEGESTQYYLNNPQPWAQAPDEMLKACLISFGYPPVFLDELIELAKTIKVDTGDLFQIFIPHTIVDSIAYLSWRQGMPFDTSIIKRLFERKFMTFSRKDKLYHEEILERYSNFKKLWQSNDPEIKDMVKQLLNNIDKGKYTLYKNKFLYNYMHHPEDFTFLNYYQARILVTNKFLLNPISGIKIYRYSSINREKKKLYKKKLAEILDQMDAIRNQAKKQLEETTIFEEIK